VGPRRAPDREQFQHGAARTDAELLHPAVQRPASDSERARRCRAIALHLFERVGDQEGLRVFAPRAKRQRLALRDRTPVALR